MGRTVAFLIIHPFLFQTSELQICCLHLRLYRGCVNERNKLSEPYAKRKQVCIYYFEKVRRKRETNKDRHRLGPFLMI